MISDPILLSKRSDIKEETNIGHNLRLNQGIGWLQKTAFSKFRKMFQNPGTLRNRLRRYKDSEHSTKRKIPVQANVT